MRALSCFLLVFGLALSYACTSDCVQCDLVNTNICRQCNSSLYNNLGQCGTSCPLTNPDGSYQFEIVFATGSGEYSGRICTQPVASSSSSSSFPLAAIIAIAVAGGCVVLVGIVVAAYIVRDRRRTAEQRQDTAEVAEKAATPRPRLRLAGDRDSFLDSTTDQATLAWEEAATMAVANPVAETRLPTGSSKPLPATVRFKPSARSLSPAATHAIDSTPTMNMTEQLSSAFHRRTASLRKKKPQLQQMMAEMTKRRDRKKHDTTANVKYASILTDLERVMLLLDYPKAEKTVPVDSIKLLDWTSATLAKFMARMDGNARPDSMHAE